MIIKVTHYDLAVVLEIGDKGYAMTRRLYENKIKPALLQRGEDIAEREATIEQKAEIRALARSLGLINGFKKGGD